MIAVNATMPFKTYLVISASFPCPLLPILRFPGTSSPEEEQWGCDLPKRYTDEDSSTEHADGARGSKRNVCPAETEAATLEKQLADARAAWEREDAAERRVREIEFNCKVWRRKAAQLREDDGAEDWVPTKKAAVSSFFHVQ